MDDRRTQCEAIVRRLWPFLDEQLLESEREEVVRHLEQCAGCLSHFDFAKAFLVAVHAARPEMKVDGALRTRVLGVLTRQGLKI